MKTLGKLHINPDKIMKNDELMALRGGYGGELWCLAHGPTCIFQVGGCSYPGSENICRQACPDYIEGAYYCFYW